jgi:AcrR family transcriptional regulator
MNQKIVNLMTSQNVSRKGAETISNIVRVGAEILLEEGFTSLTKRKIATRLGISHGNVGYYFPTRESLWRAVVDYELKEYYKNHHANFDVNPDDAQANFDDYVRSWIDEYDDRMVRVFFSHIIAFGEVNEFIGELRDEIYEMFFDQTMKLASDLNLGVDKSELERRVLTVIVLLEGLHVVSAFRPTLASQDNKFKELLVKQANDIIHGVHSD